MNKGITAGTAALWILSMIFIPFCIRNGMEIGAGLVGSILFAFLWLMVFWFLLKAPVGEEYQGVNSRGMLLSFLHIGVAILSAVLAIAFMEANRPFTSAYMAYVIAVPCNVLLGLILQALVLKGRNTQQSKWILLRSLPVMAACYHLLFSFSIALTVPRYVRGFWARLGSAFDKVVGQMMLLYCLCCIVSQVVVYAVLYYKAARSTASEIAEDAKDIQKG